MKTIYTSGVMLVMLCLLFACQPNAQTADGQSDFSESDIAESVVDFAQVAPPIPGQEVAFTSFTIETSSEQVIELDNGTQITIPANSLLDGQGNPITGKATLQYREFHDVVDVLFSGIPMGVMNGEKKEIFQTAGMMEIHAEQDGQSLSVDPNKPISVEMASYRFAEGSQQTTPEGYGQYFFNEEKGQWETLKAQDQPQPNPRLAQATEADSSSPMPAAPKKPRKATKPNETFNFAVDYSKFPELADYKDISWEYASIAEAGTVNPNTDSWVFTEAWKTASIESRKGSKEIFYIKLNRPGKEAKMIVRPVVSNESYAAAMQIYQRQQAQYKALRKQRDAAQSLAEQRAKSVSLFSVANFGIYNIDRFYKRNSVKQVQAQFVFDSFSLEDDLPAVYHVVKDANAVIPYYHQRNGYTWNGDFFRFYPREKNSLVSFIGGDMYSFSEGEFKRATINAAHTFDLKRIGPANSQTLKELLQS